MFRRVRSSNLSRSRWAAIGAAVAVSLGAGGIGLIANAANSAPSSFVPITPCRLFDTRPAPANVGDRNTPLDAGEDFERTVWGTNGQCTIPAAATAISYNLTIPNGLDGYLTLHPADSSPPNASSINPVTGQGVKVNAGNVGLSADGKIKLFSLRGPIDALLDITGYFVPANTGPAGPAGAAGPAGPVGPIGPPGAAAVGGVEFGSGTTGVNVGTADTVVASIVVTAPSAGFVVVTGAATFFMEAAVGGKCTITTGTTFSGSRLLQVLSSDSYTSWSSVNGFAVSAGANTFNLVCASTSTATVWDPNLIAVFSATRL